MKTSIYATILALLATSTFVLGEVIECGPNKKCPSDTPCCGLYNQCGVGAFCLGGCNPTFSHSLDSCLPAPVCESKEHTFKNKDRIAPIGKYLGDASKADWVSEGEPLEHDGGLLLTMAPDTVGTVLSSTHYIWYGKVSTTLSTSQGAGVVTAFILMSNARDEIDYEFVGNNMEQAQTNYYFQGIPDYDKGVKLPVSNTRENTHTYTVNWTPDKIEWEIDGKVLRTLNRADTWDPVTKRHKFPQTPARIMISLWPAGLPTSGEGTIEWGGGLVDWKSPYMQNGYYYAVLKKVNVECYDPPAGAKIKGSKSYIYTDTSATENSIELSDKVVVLKSIQGTGNKPDYDPNSSKSSSGSQPSKTPQSIPGMSGSGVNNHDSDDSRNGSSTSTGGSSSTSTGFSQATSPSSQGDAALTSPVLGSSVFAVVIALSALFAL